MRRFLFVTLIFACLLAHVAFADTPVTATEAVQATAATPGASDPTLREPVSPSAGAKTPGGMPASSPSVMRLRPEPNAFSSGPNGDLFMDSPSPFTTVGVLMQARSTFPNIVAKLGTADGTSSFAVDNVNNSQLFTVQANGNVGIGGTPNSFAKLHLLSDGTLVNNFIRLTDTATSGREYGLFNRLSGFPGLFGIYDLTAGAARLTIDSIGRVGIGTGTTQLTDKLHVEGNINVSGNINAKYQDVAEWVPASADLAAGTVVVLDTRSPNTVRASDRSYDESVAGVVSVQPGLLLGERGASKEMVATTGRVRVRVDASRNPIRIGDLLVTSDKSGFAMRSQPIEVGNARIHRPGTLIGKALEPLATGEGEILVLLSLQ